MTGSGAGGPGESIGWEEEADRLASRALAAGDATGWFEQLYAAGAVGCEGSRNWQDHDHQC